MNNNNITQLSVRGLLGHTADYIIPMYQRNYAWEEGEITQLIQDVIDQLSTPEKNYYIGTLVVFEQENHSSAPARTAYETIDGQQRFTTLSLLAAYLKNEKLPDEFEWYKTINIHFESRKHSTMTFARIFSGSQNSDMTKGLAPEDTNAALINGYKLIKKLLPQKLAENKVDSGNFTEYLLEKVQIIRVKVPYDTDLNHYFEIMNNRGEQLEKHEILKAKLMDVLNGIEGAEERGQSIHTLHTIWEACANMEKYVQLGFTKEQRHLLFGEKNWSQFNAKDFDELRQILGHSEQKMSVNTITSIIAPSFQHQGNNNGSDEEAPERFNNVINFPNFLLHILRIQLEADIPLDDKRLIDTFDQYLLGKGDAFEQVKQFIFNLFKGKYLFDQYIIKREFLKGEDAWSLKRYQWYDGGTKAKQGRGNYKNTFGNEEDNTGENRRILMLLAAFHVSTPTLVYKHWLNAALYFLFKKKTITPVRYRRYLESVAKSFVFDRFLTSPENGKAEYFQIVFTNEGKPQSQREQFDENHLRHQLSFGNIENNLVFNYLDYLLWRDHQETNQLVRDYEFTFRSSVEHYYPQHPMPGYESMPDELLNSFGNLCLISHSKNSRLSNFMPEAKKEYYAKNTIDSVKQHLMMQKKRWGETEIEEHYQAMKNRLLDSLKKTDRLNA